MADKTIDDLTALGAAPAGGSYVPVWESGATKKVSVTNLLTNAGSSFEYSDRFDNSSSTKTILGTKTNGFVEVRETADSTGLVFGQGGGNAIFLRSTEFRPATDDSLNLGASSYRWNDIYATNTTIQSSDERLKTEVQPVSNALDLVNRLNPVSYKWKDYDFQTTQKDADGNVQTVTSRKTHSRRHWGLIAQEFKSALENAGLDPAQVAAFIDPAAAGQEGNMGIRYGELVAVALAAIKELSARVEALEA